VLDPCAGSGVIGVACRLLGREYLGFEINPEWSAKAALREVSPLSDRDRKRVDEWLVYSAANDEVAEPRNVSERATYERYLRRRADRERVSLQLINDAAYADYMRDGIPQEVAS
jgi:hypothetical protein